LKRVLIVDPDFRKGDPLSYLLAAQHFEVLSADSVEDAWRMIVAGRPDLVLMEPMLPSGTEGFHLVWRLRDHPDSRLRATPVVIVSRIHQTVPLDLFPTLHDGHYQANEFLPVQAFLDKPYETATLMNTIDQVLLKMPDRPWGADNE
jgi:CheY-like chemotaxis protein